MNLDLTNGLISEKEYLTKDFSKKITDVHIGLRSENHSAGTTWVDWPVSYDKKEFSKVLKLAKDIENNSEALLVVGIGGSYLGAKAGIDMLCKKSNVEIVFAGINFDYNDLATKLDNLKNKEVTVNIVSKSGTTVEILAALAVVEKFMKNKYKNDFKKRMIFTTDKENGYLSKRAIKDGIETLTVPAGMGGRYSVLSSVGLLPFACAGLNIKKIMEGANTAYNDLLTDNISENPAYKYAIYRYLLGKKLGKKVELFASFNPKLSSFGAWLQQLFAESEGKDGKGLFVCPATFSTDLHSVGQFIQQGSPIVAETFIQVENGLKNTTLSGISADSPIKFLEGKTFEDINHAAFEGTLKAHIESNVPIATVTIDEINEFNFGYLVYFFELSCAASGYLLGVNPFNQPGVEQYKSHMKQLLNK